MRYYYHSHFTDKDPGMESFRNFSKVVKQAVEDIDLILGGLALAFNLLNLYHVYIKNKVQ